MIKYNLQYFGGRGASGTLKNPNGKVAKSRNSGESGGGSNSGNDTDALERSLKAEYGNDNVELYLNGKMTYFQLADEIGNSGADMVDNLKKQKREETFNQLLNDAQEKYSNAILSDDKERKVKNDIIKELREKTGIGETVADKYLSKIKINNNEYDGKTYFKNSAGKIQDLQLNGNTNFGLVKKDGGKAKIYIAISGKEQGVREIKAVEANVYNIDGRDIAIHKPYGASGRGTGYHVTDVATGLSVSSKFYGSKEKALADVRSSNIVSSVKSVDFNKNNSRSSLNQFRAIQQKLDEEKKRKKR